MYIQIFDKLKLNIQENIQKVQENIQKVQEITHDNIQKVQDNIQKVQKNDICIIKYNNELLYLYSIITQIQLYNILKLNLSDLHNIQQRFVMQH